MVDVRSLAPGARAAVTGLLTGVSDPQLSFMWEVEVNTPTRTHDFEKSMFLYARTCTIPPRTIEPMERRYIGEVISHPGHSVENRQIEVNLWDDKKLFGYRYFQQWLNLISDPHFGRQVLQNHYKRKVTIRLKDRSDIFTGVKLEFDGAYVSNISDVMMSYEESMPLIYNVSIRFDKMSINGTDYEIGEVGSPRGSSSSLMTADNRAWQILNDLWETM